MAKQKNPFIKIPAAVVLLRLLAVILPTDYLRTWFYRNLVQRPRKLLRTLLSGFYRIDHVYDVLDEFSKHYQGRFSVLEFGVSAGYSFTKILYATRYLGLAERITVHGFDTFEGMPETENAGDRSLVDGGHWSAGQFASPKEDLEAYCKGRYSNFALHQGMFADSLTAEFLERLRDEPPILIWVDCDYYSSSLSIFEKLIPFIPTGCVIYFDEPEFNFGSRLTGEMRLIHEINSGKFGDQVELVLDRALSLDTQRIYRFINLTHDRPYQLVKRFGKAGYTRKRSNDSPLP